MSYYWLKTACYDMQVRSKLHSNKSVSLEMRVKEETDIHSNISYIRLDGILYHTSNAMLTCFVVVHR